MDLPPPPPDDVRALEAGELQTHWGFGSTPRVRGKGGAAVWALSIWSLEGDVELGLVQAGPFTFGAGLGGAWGRPVVVEGFSARVIESRVGWADLDLAASHWGLEASAFMHLARDPDGRFQPYVELGVGPQQLNLSAVYDGLVLDGEAVYTLTSVVVDHGIGFDLSLTDHLLLNAELAYAKGVWSERTSHAAVEMKQIPLFETEAGRRVTPPRGWTVGVAVGRRF